MWDGKEEPRKLDESEISKVEPELLAPKPKAPLISSITEYSWADGKDNVKIYVDHDRADEIDDSNINIQINDASFSFTFAGRDGRENSLIINNLHDSLDSGTVKKKSDKFIITLKKVLAASWYQLKKS